MCDNCDEMIINYNIVLCLFIEKGYNFVYMSIMIIVYHCIYHFSVGVQRHRLVFNLHIAWAISWESGLPMTLMPSQIKETICFDSLY